jgi:hypothetical protein
VCDQRLGRGAGHAGDARWRACAVQQQHPVLCSAVLERTGRPGRLHALAQSPDLSPFGKEHERFWADAHGQLGDCLHPRAVVTPQRRRTDEPAHATEPLTP